MLQHKLLVKQKEREKAEMDRVNKTTGSVPPTNRLTPPKK